MVAVSEVASKVCVGGLGINVSRGTRHVGMAKVLKNISIDASLL